MPYYEIQNFAAGMDVRKSALTAPAGTLRTLINAHVTPGGEVEKRQAFIKTFTAPAGTFGIVSIGDVLWAVTQGAAAAAMALPSKTTLGTLALTAPAGVTLTKILDWDSYNSKFYIIALGSDGKAYHFFDGTAVADGKGTSCRVYRSKMYTVDGPLLRFSAVGAPADWKGTGSGFVDLAVEDSEMKRLVGLEVYYDKLAVLSDRATQIWSVDPDPNKNQLTQTLRQAGTYAPRSVRQYGSGDILYLSYDGIRSLKARVQSITAAVTDIGSPIDPTIRGLTRSSAFTGMEGTISLLEPLSGRYWVVMKETIYVLSNYPAPKISAWGTYVPGFKIVDATTDGTVIYLLSDTGDIYRYGNGTDDPIFDSCPVEVKLPFLSFDKPATFKQFNAFDCSASGLWDVGVGLNPHNEAAEDQIGRVDGPTFLTGQFPLMGHSTHVSLRFRGQFPGPATLSNVMIHYREAETT